MIPFSRKMVEKDTNGEFFNENVKETSEISQDELDFDGVVLLISKSIFDFFKEESINVEDSHENIATHPNHLMVSSNNSIVNPLLDYHEKHTKEWSQHNEIPSNEQDPRSSMSNHFTKPNRAAQNEGKTSFHHKKTSVHRAVYRIDLDFNYHRSRKHRNSTRAETSNTDTDLLYIMEAEEPTKLNYHIASEAIFRKIRK